MGANHTISPKKLTLNSIDSIQKKQAKLSLSKESRERISKNRKYLENKIAGSDQPFYGINTGFGSLRNTRISKDNLSELQENLVKSHAAGIGDEVPEEIVRLMMLLKIHSLALGCSGVRVKLIERLIQFYNHGLTPVVYQLGSLGASGDLAPLAHLSLPILGLGKVRLDGKLITAKSALKKLKMEPMSLVSKEGLALLNGTQFSTAYSVWAILETQKLMYWANASAALSLEGFLCHTSPFDERIQLVRPHEGQIEIGKIIRDFRKGSPIEKLEKNDVQDPYAFRCIPQVHGASWNAIQHVKQVISTEIHAVTDNPMIFSDTDAIISAGNFHAQLLALPLDYLGLALHELGNISERRTFQLMMGLRELPAYLTLLPGVNSGLMIAQYTAASIVSQNKQLCTPASADSIVSSNGQEDHVSMAANAATKTWRIVENLWRILAIEWMSAAQALDLQRPLKTSRKLEKLHAAYREKVPMLKKDRVISEDIEKTILFLRE